MERDEMLMVFCYDVSSDRDRRCLAALLEARLMRVQRSVFEAPMSQAEAEALAARAALELGPGDSLRVYAVGRNGLARTRVYGAAIPPLTEDYYLL